MSSIISESRKRSITDEGVTRILGRSTSNPINFNSSMGQLMLSPKSAPSSTRGSPRFEDGENIITCYDNWSEIYDDVWTNGALCQPLVQFPADIEDKTDIEPSMETQIHTQMIIAQLKVIQNQIKTSIENKCRKLKDLYTSDKNNQRLYYLKIIREMYLRNEIISECYCMEQPHSCECIFFGDYKDILLRLDDVNCNISIKQMKKIIKLQP